MILIIDIELQIRICDFSSLYQDGITSYFYDYGNNIKYKRKISL